MGAPYIYDISRLRVNTLLTLLVRVSEFISSVLLEYQWTHYVISLLLASLCYYQITRLMYFNIFLFVFFSYFCFLVCVFCIFCAALPLACWNRGFESHRGAWIFVCCECRVLSGRGLCDELIARPEASYRLWCVVVCDLETSRRGAPYIYIYIYMTLVA